MFAIKVKLLQSFLVSPIYFLYSQTSEPMSLRSLAALFRIVDFIKQF